LDNTYQLSVVVINKKAPRLGTRGSTFAVPPYFGLLRPSLFRYDSIRSDTLDFDNAALCDKAY